MADSTINITNLSSNNTTTLTYNENGKIATTDGIMTYKYVKGTTTLYRKIIWKDGNFRQYDENGEQVGEVYTKNHYNFQYLLSRAKSGGTLTIRFYHGTFRVYGPYRIYGNTTILAPSNDVIFEKMRSIYLFINTDDESAKAYDFTRGYYAGSGNIKIDGIQFEMKNLNSQIGKFIHGTGFTISNCTVKNGKFDSHVFEFTSLKNVKVQNCVFQDLKVGWTEKSTDKVWEVLQIESATEKGFPYCLYSKYGYVQRCNGVTVSSCTFKNVTIAIGNHSTSSSADNYQSNIVVSNCDFDGAKKEKKVQFSDLTKVTFK